MARRKVILPNWSANEADSKSIEMLGAEFSDLTQGELVINTNVDNTLLSTLNGDGKVVVFESSEMIDKRLEGFLDKVHQHDNKDVLDSITSGRTDAWDKAESNARTYTDQQIDFIVSGASEAFDTLKEVEIWINNNSGETKNIIESINGLYASAHTHDNKTLLDNITLSRIESWDKAITEISAVTKDNSNVISVSGKTVTIDLTNVGDENIIEEIKVNNSALTISGKSVNIDLKYLEDAIEEIELTPGPKGDDGTMWYNGAELPQPQTTAIRMGDLFLETTNSNVYRKTSPSEWSLIGNIKGDKGDKGDDGTSIKILGSVNSPEEFPGNPSNGDGYMLDGHLWVYDGVSWVDAGEIKGPKGDPGTNAYVTAVTASISDTTGVPTVKVTTGGTHSEMSIDFDFDNLKGPKGDKGTSITSIGRTGGNGAAGTTDVYTITYSDGTTSTFNVYNGEDGKDGENGDDGITPVFTAVTASVNNTIGTPQVSVVTAKTSDEKYSMEFSFQNIKGEKGDKGDDGTSVKILGTKNSYAELPSSNNVNGDGYIIGENLYVWNGSTWQDVGKIKGPQGNPGTNAYITGVTASVGNTTGTPSVDVTTAGTPSNISFNLSFNGLKGEPGDDGENGIGIKSFIKTNGDGAAGTTDTYTITFTNGVTSAITVYNGSNGSNGEDGANGNMWHVGAGIPLPELGVAGDLYLEGIAGTVYQKRDGDYWLPTDCNLRGSDGKDGQDGTNGDNGIGIKSFVKTNGNGAAGTTDTYTVTFTNDVTSAITVYNGSNGTNGEDGEDGADGIGIKSFVKTSGDGAAGTTDTYTITFTNDVTSAITVYNGSNGTNGEDGQDGAPGAPGAPGTNGSTWYNGITAPSTDTGVNGDWYLNTLTWDISYKESNSWVTKGNIKGQTGTFDSSALNDYALKTQTGITITKASGKIYILGASDDLITTGDTDEKITRSIYVSSTDIYMDGGEVYAASDERLKDFGDNVEVDFNELSEIPKVYYSWKDDEEKRQMIGTSAQKLKEIYPELVSENEDGKMAVSYEKLSIIALAAVDKLHKENEELKNRLKRIEEKLGL